MEGRVLGRIDYGRETLGGHRASTNNVNATEMDSWFHPANGSVVSV